MLLQAAKQSNQTIIMKFLIILLIVVASVGTFFISSSDALLGPVAPRSDPSLPEISFQLEYRDSNGMLVAYIEPSIFYLRNIPLIHDMLDSKENKVVFTRDGRQYEKVEFEIVTHSSVSGDQKAGYSVGWDGYGVLWARYNGILSGDGDTVTAHWTIVRPI